MTHVDAPAAGLLGNGDYRLWWAGDTFAALGSAVQGFALPLVAAIATGSVAAGGLVATAYLVAAVVLGLPGGVLVDRVDRRRLLVAQAVSGLVVWGLLALVVAAGVAGLGWLVALAVLGGVRTGLFNTLTNACLQQVVAPEQIPTAMSANQGRDAVVGLLGSPFGGALLVLGPFGPFVASAVLSLATLVPAVGVRASLDPGRADTSSPWGDLREGVAYAWRFPLLRGFVGMALLLNLALSGLVTTVLFSLLRSGTPVWQLGLVEGVVGVGVLVGAVVAPTLARRFAGGVVVLGLLVWTAVFAVLLALPLPLWALTVVMLLMGLGIAPINAVLGGVVTTVVPADRLGRVSAVGGTGAMALGALAPALAGWGLSVWGHGATAGVFVVLLVLGTLLGLLSPALRSLPRAAEWSTVSLQG